jgi:HK97 family phage prohead protease
MDYMSFPFEVKFAQESADPEIKTFSGYASTFGNVDRGNDVVEKGAFQSNRNSVPMLWNHNLDDPIGIFKNYYEDDVGLKVEGEINLLVRKGAEAYSLLKKGHLNTMSIGYRVITRKYDEEKNIRYLQKVELLEISLTPLPMNPKAVVREVHSYRDRMTEEEFICQMCDLGFSRKEAHIIATKGFSALKVPDPVLSELSAEIRKLKELSSTRFEG